MLCQNHVQRLHTPSILWSHCAWWCTCQLPDRPSTSKDMIQHHMVYHKVRNLADTLFWRTPKKFLVPLIARTFPLNYQYQGRYYPDGCCTCAHAHSYSIVTYEVPFCIKMVDFVIVSSPVTTAYKQSSIATFCVPMTPGHKRHKRSYSPVKTQKPWPVGWPPKRPRRRPADMCSEVTGTDTVHEWNEWVGVMEANDSELVTFYSTLYLSATIAIATLPARVKVPCQRYPSLTDHKVYIPIQIPTQTGV